MPRLLIIAGIALVVTGVLWHFAGRGSGPLPGDIHIKREGFTLYFPVMTCIIISLVLSAVLWFFRR